MSLLSPQENRAVSGPLLKSSAKRRVANVLKRLLAHLTVSAQLFDDFWSIAIDRYRTQILRRIVKNNTITFEFDVPNMALSVLIDDFLNRSEMKTDHR